jgi:hypothetical protein
LFSVANASVIKFEVKGGADYVNSVLSPYFSLDDDMTLKFAMDLDITGYESDSFSSYNQKHPMAFGIGAYTGSVSSYQPSITNGPNCSFVCGDVWAAEAKNEFGTAFNFPIFGNYYLDIVHLEYTDDSGTALNTVNMASSISQLNNFSNWALSLYFKNTQDPSGRHVSVTAFSPDVTIMEVPEPSILAILVLGFTGLLYRQRNPLNP